ncbi:MAG: MraY family glycosyltransferase [Phycisphaeraceae bacterium]
MQTSIAAPLVAQVAWSMVTAFCVTAILGEVVLRLARRLSLNDQPDREQHKAHSTQVPNIGGVAITLGLLAGILAVTLPVLTQTRWLILTLLGMIALHLLGLVDDRRGLGAWLKLSIQALVAIAIVTLGEVRVLTLLDDTVPGGYLISTSLSVLWLLVICNAINFLDNMDGLASSVSAVAAMVFLAAALLTGQSEVAWLSAAAAGGCLGFLLHNAPPARMYMGDGGSLVLGLALGVISIQLTYVQADNGEIIWYGVLTPLIVLAVPVYDFLSVVLLRLRAGRSPMSADRNHLSHRLVRLGLNPPAAVGLIAILTLATGLGGVLLAALTGWQALLVAAQTLAILTLVAIFESLGSSTDR